MPTLEAKSLTAYNLIREYILSGEALPGSRLILADLEQKFNVGRGSLREALLKLDKSGLVQNIPYKGAIVTPPPSFKEMGYIYQAREYIELVLALEAMKNISPKDLKVLEKSAQKIIKNQENETSFFLEDREFHTDLYKLANMPHLQTVVNSLLDHVEVFLNNRAYGQNNKKIIIEQHDAILEALRNKNEDKLKESLKQNIHIGMDLIYTEVEHS